MANDAPKRGGGRDTVLESRHVVGMFLGVVVLCGVFFTLGYVMGRTQYESSVRAVTGAGGERSTAAAKPVEKAPASTSSGWDLTSNSAPKATEAKPSSAKAGAPAASKAPSSAVSAQPSKIAPPEKTAAHPAGKTAAPAAEKSKNPLLKSPAIPRGGVMLQVAALTRQNDALALADALQKKGFPAFVLTPPTGNLFRVQVGPYSDAKAAEAGKKALEREGFKAITKR